MIIKKLRQHRIQFIRLCGMMAFFFSFHSLASPPGSGWNLIFEDNFDSFNSNRWQKTLANDTRVTGWSPDTYFADEQVTISNGKLVLTAIRSTQYGTLYASGSVTTDNTAEDFKFPLNKKTYIEGRIKAPRGRGLWTAFWSTRGCKFCWPPEIDYVELWDEKWPNLAYQTWHYNPGGSESHKQVQYRVSGRQSPWNFPQWGGEGWYEDYHVWASLWDPATNTIEFYIDGVLIGSTTEGVEQHKDQSMGIILNLACGGNWPPEPDSTTPFPSSIYADWIRVWQAGSGGGGGGGGTPSVLPAENASVGGGATVQSNNAGYNGSGFVNFPNNNGFVEWLNVDGEGGGDATLTFRYALGASNSRTVDLIVNGVTQQITFTSTGSWSSWAPFAVNVNLNAGTGNTIRVISTGQDSGNIDEMLVEVTGGGSGGGGGTVSLQAEDATRGGNTSLETQHAGYNGTGYINYPSNNGFVEWSNIDGGNGGQTALSFRYALGSSSSRSVDLTVNGSTQTITFTPSGSWNSWTTLDINVNLNSGTGNTIRVQSTGQDCGNIDELVISN